MNQVATGKFLDSGQAPYKDDPKNQPSYFIEIQNDKGTSSKFWGTGLEDALKNNDTIQKGDTIALVDKGIIDGSKKRVWEIEKYEPTLELNNKIENGVEKKQSIDKNIDDVGQVKVNKDQLKDEIDLPESIKNNYIAMVRNRLFKDERINFYDKEDAGVVVFEDRNSSLNTSREDAKTVKAMLDLAQAKNWSSISLKGTEEFKKQVWLEANIRGIETKGYAPSEKDLAELKAYQEQRTVNAIAHDPIAEKKTTIEIEKSTNIEVKTEQQINNPVEQKIEQQKDDRIENEKLVALINTYLDELPHQEQGVTKNTGIDKLRLTLDSYKDQLEQKDLIAIEGYKNVIQERFKNDPVMMTQKFEALANKIPDVANGKIDLPPPPVVKTVAEIDVQTKKQSDQDRSR